MNHIDRKIISLLGDDARRSLADVCGKVSLSPSAVNERIRKLAAGSVIRRYTVDIAPSAVPLPPFSPRRDRATPNLSLVESLPPARDDPR